MAALFHSESVADAREPPTQATHNPIANQNYGFIIGIATVNESGAMILTLKGVPGSPYTRKMLAVLRYRRIPYRLMMGSHDAEGLPRPKVSLLPTFYFPGRNGELEAVTDSTPIILRLEQDHAGREVKPRDAVLRLLDDILEDYGDEWLTKAMFHYRWAYDPDIAKAAAILPTWRGRMDDALLAIVGREVAKRQIERLRYVGSNPTTGPVIEASYHRFLDILEAHLRDHPFLLGGRPGAGDFALFGQLTQLAAFDPTPMALTVEKAPRVCGWVGAVEDLSGLEPADQDWFSAEALPATTAALLAEAGRVYAPLLVANARALARGEQNVETEIDGRAWVQQAFPYQAKCLGWLRSAYAALSASDKPRADAVLGPSGWLSALAAPL